MRAYCKAALLLSLFGIGQADSVFGGRYWYLHSVQRLPNGDGSSAEFFDHKLPDEELKQIKETS